MTDETVLRQHLARILDWQDAHATFDQAIEGIPPELRGRRPPGAAHSPWEVLEHIRRAQHDILDFAINPQYRETMKWPDDYWPESPEPPSASAWDDSVSRYHADREGVRRLALDPKVDLGAKIPHGTGQTYLRAILLVADHTAYHTGELVTLRKQLGSWGS
jgi:hypothetical protein